MKVATAVVSGASRGIGRHCADALVGQGYRVVGLSRTVPSDAGFEIRQCDVADAGSVEASLRDLRRDQSVFALINAAGVASMNLAVAMPAATTHRIVATNLLGTIYCCQLLAQPMMRARRGRIINFSTIAVSLALKGESVYVASKAGVEGFTRSFAREVADHGVTVNAVAPGPIATDLIGKIPPSKIKEIVQRQIIGRMAEKDEVWRVVQFLLSEQASMLSGEVLHIGGA